MSTWDATEPILPFVSPTGARFVTGDQALGHVTVLASPYDEFVSLYMQTPTGFLIEYGYGERRVDSPDDRTEVQQAGVPGAGRWGHHSTDLAPSTSDRTASNRS